MCDANVWSRLDDDRSDRTQMWTRTTALRPFKALVCLVVRDFLGLEFVFPSVFVSVTIL